MIWTMEPTAKKLEDVETKVGNVGSTDLQSQVTTLNNKIGNVGSTDLQSQVNTLNSKTYSYNVVDAIKVSDSFWTSGAIRAYRKGCIVTFKVDGASFSDVPSRTTIATLPAGYRPVTEVAFWDDRKSRQFVISTNGEVKAGTQSAGQAWGAVTYVCDFS